MCAKKAKTTKKKIVSAAWKLFYEQGYDNTTVDDIVEESGTSKGSFYHYFEGKDALLSSLSFLFDEKYEELMPSVDPQMHSVDKLLYLNRELFGVIENTVSLELLARLFSSQLNTKGERHLLDSSRVYYKILRQIISEGQQQRADPQRYHGKRDFQALRGRRARSHVRLVYLRRQLLAEKLCGVGHAAAAGVHPGKIIFD